MTGGCAGEEEGGDRAKSVGVSSRLKLKHNLLRDCKKWPLCCHHLLKK